MDVSAGIYQVSKIKTKNCVDKGISVGEKSKMKIDLFEVENSYVGLSSKDLSVTSIKNFKQKNLKNCFEVAQKKQEFGGSRLILDNVNCKENQIDINSRITQNES